MNKGIKYALNGIRTYFNKNNKNYKNGNIRNIKKIKRKIKDIKAKNGNYMFLCRIVDDYNFKTFEDYLYDNIENVSARSKGWLLGVSEEEELSIKTFGDLIKLKGKDYIKDLSPVVWPGNDYSSREEWLDFHIKKLKNEQL
tara:strand:- start:182 stop:604 length:423 start_codon:yes stop_codon:yes gene_type:complete